MRGTPARLAAVAVVGLTVAFGAPPFLARGVSPLAGLVRDALGNAVADAEVLLSDGQRAAPFAVLRSDVLGRIFLAELPAGPYRIAAVKEGYLTLVHRRDGGASDWVELVLQPAVRLDPQEIPDDAWVLRLPRTYLLRDVEDEPLEAGTRVRSPERTAALADPLRLQVDHLVAVHPGFHSGAGDSEVAGSETTVRVASAVGARGGIEVEGYRHAIETTGGDGFDFRTSDRDAAGLRVGLSLATEPDSDLAMTAFWGRSELGYVRMDESVPMAPSEIAQAQRSWGYGATWSKPLDADSRLDLAMDFHDTSVSSPASGGPRPVTAGDDRLTSRAVGAAGTFASTPSSAHEVQVEFGARLLDAADAFRVAPGARAGEVQGLPGLSVGIEAQDRWSVGGPATVIYGLGYRHTVQPLDVAVIVPRVGGAMRFDRAELTASLSYHGLAGTDAGPATDGRREFRGSGDVGYEIVADVPLTPTLRLAGSASYAPSQLGIETYRARSEALGAAMFVSDGDVAVREQRLALCRSNGPIRGRLDVIAGSASGFLDAAVPVDGRVYRLAEREARYVGGLVGLHAVPTRTRITVAYRVVEQSAPGGLDSDEMQRLRIVEFEVAQDLFRQRSLGTWRALAGLRAAAVEAGTDEDDDEVLSTIGRQLSAGVSVVF